MTKQPNTLHLIERAARRLLETDDQVASQLLGKQSAAPPAPASADVEQPLPRGLVETRKNVARSGSDDRPPSTERLAAPPSDASGPASAPEALPQAADPADAGSGRAASAPLADHAARLGRVAPKQAGIGPAPRPRLSKAGVVDDATLRNAGMIDWTMDRERLAEEFRIVQGQVLRALATTIVRPPGLANMVMLTSARPGEGKTFSSLNLAGSLASCSSRSVILVDVDSKRHSLSSRLDLRTRPGLLDTAFDAGVQLDDVLADTSLSGLRILPVGRSDLQSSVSGGKSIVRVLERLGRAYPDSLVVLDTPPCLSSSDPSTLAPIVGGVVMLIEAQRTQRAEVEAALELVAACPTTLLLLNKVQLTGSDTFGAYDY